MEKLNDLKIAYRNAYKLMNTRNGSRYEELTYDSNILAIMQDIQRYMCYFEFIPSGFGVNVVTIYPNGKNKFDQPYWLVEKLEFIKNIIMEYINTSK